MIEERIRKAPSGVPALLVLLLLFALDVYMLVRGSIDGTLWLILVTSLLIPVILILSAGLFTVAPNEARVLQLFGSYVGTVRDTGLRYTNPLYSKRRISVRVRNFETEFEGQRHRRQPDRDRRGGGVESRRHRRSQLRGG